MVKVLFVCMGNICRSPTAEGVFRERVRAAGLEGRISADSAGTHAYHVGEPPDGRSQAAALRRGVDLSDLRARQVVRQDFDRFDYVLAMDAANYERLRELCPPGREPRLRLFLEFTQGAAREVPDPYYGGPRGFEQVLDMVEEGAQALLEHIRAEHGL